MIVIMVFVTKNSDIRFRTKLDSYIGEKWSYRAILSYKKYKTAVNHDIHIKTTECFRQFEELKSELKYFRIIR